MAANARLAEILSDYNAAMTHLESRTVPPVRPDHGWRRRFLQSADRQRSCVTPTLADPQLDLLNRRDSRQDGRQGYFSRATIFSSGAAGANSRSAATVLGNTTSGSANSR